MYLQLIQWVLVRTIKYLFISNDGRNNIVEGFESGIMYIKIPKNLEILRDEEYNYINN